MGEGVGRWGWGVQFSSFMVLKIIKTVENVNVTVNVNLKLLCPFGHMGT